MMLRRIGALAAVTVLALGVAAPVLAASAAPGTYTLCVTSKSARYESTTKPCKSPEKRIRVPNADELRIPLSTSGAQGETGATGPAGPAGPKGDVGARGWQGWRGQTGPRGPVGPTGPKGDAGAPGKNGGVVVLETLGLDLSAFGVPNITKIVCSDNTSTDPANPDFSKCVKKVAATPSATPSPTPTLTPVP